MARPAVPQPESERPELSRRLAGGSPGARGLLFTVLGELILPSQEPAWTTALIEVFGRLGVEEKATRQALLRTADAGWITSERIGRRTRWHLTAAARGLLADGADRIYHHAGSLPGWDRRWLVVLARVREPDRRQRHLLRTRLSWAGLGTPAPGVWIGPRPDRLPQVRAVLDRAGVVEAQCLVAEHGYGDEQAMVRAAWDVDAIADGYQDFVRSWTGARAGADPLAAQVDLVHRWRRFPQIDPELPAELLPDPWPGDTAARLFRAHHDRLRDPAAAAWRALNAG